MDKVREEFEKWAKQFFKLEVEDWGEYVESETQWAWLAWRASREDIVVKLPEKQDEKACLFDFQRAYVQGYNHGIDACAKQLSEEGIKYE